MEFESNFHNFGRSIAMTSEGVLDKCMCVCVPRVHPWALRARAVRARARCACVCCFDILKFDLHNYVYLMTFYVINHDYGT